jgi:hypothetical protein
MRPGAWLMLVTPATQEVEIGKIMVHGQSGQRVSETPSQLIKLRMVVCACHLTDTDLESIKLKF